MANDIEQLIEKELVIKKGNWYYTNDGDNKVTLGNTKEKAFEKYHQIEGKRPAPSKKASGNPEPEPIIGVGKSRGEPQQLPKKLDEALEENEVTSQEEAGMYADLLGLAKDISPNVGKGALNVLLNGVNIKLNNHPVIKKSPLVFRWLAKENNVKNGSKLTNKGYIVLSKELVKKSGLKIEVKKDDSPNEDHYSVGVLCLCYTNKKDYERRHLHLELDSITRAKKSRDNRNEFSRQQSKTDTHTAVANYSGADKVDSELIPSGLSAEEKQKAFDDAKNEAGQSNVGENIEDF